MARPVYDDFVQRFAEAVRALTMGPGTDDPDLGPLMNAAAAQLAHHYGIPIYNTAGLTDSKVSDIQAGYEKVFGCMAAGMAGGNFIHDAAGFLEFCMTASYDKLVIDDEIIGMVMRAVEGIRVDDDTLAIDELMKVGPGGHFVSSRHTRRHMRTEQFMPKLSDRDGRETDGLTLTASLKRAIGVSPMRPLNSIDGLVKGESDDS